MKFLVLVALVPLASCSLVEPFTAASQDPGIQAAVIDTAQAAASGNVSGIVTGIASTIGAYLAWRSGKHVVNRMKDSQPGQII